MTGELCWKEYREHRPVWLVIAVTTVVLVLGLGAALAPGGLGTVAHDPQLRGALEGLVLVMAVAYGLVCGSMMLAGEREAGTLVFLDTLAGRRASVWTTKALLGAGFTLAQALLLAGVATAAGLRERPTPGVLFLLLPVLALDGYAWGLAGSAFCRNVFAAAVLASVFLGATWLVSGVVAWAFDGGGVLASRAALAVAGVLLSRHVFCEPDRRRADATSTLAAAGTGWAPGWRVLLWLTVRQGRLEAGIVLGVAFVLGLLLPLGEPLLWGAGILAVGVVCGAAVFAPEQEAGSYRFLGDQRFPAGLVWAVKEVCWFAWAVATAAAVLLGIALFHTLRSGQRSGDMRSWDFVDRFLANQWVAGPRWALTVILLLGYGFAAGQFAALVLRRQAIAVVVGGMTTAALLTLWLPSLLLGGLPAWQVLGPPLLLLAATRLVVWAWIGGRLVALRPVAALLGCVALAALWMAGCLWYRVAGVPDVGEPFDVKAFAASLSELDRTDAGRLIREASRELAKQREEVTAKLGPPKKPLFPDERTKASAPAGAEEGAHQMPQTPPEVFSYGEQLDEVLHKGWPKDAVELGHWLDALFARTWAADFRKAAALPLGLVQDPHSVQEAALLFSARALQLQARGDDTGGLDQVAVALGLARQLRHKTPLQHLLYSLDIEDTALEVFNRWLEKLGPRKELLRRALDVLRRHEEQTPPVSDNIKAEYYQFRNLLDETFSPRAGLRGQLFAFARQVPWEKERERRLLNGYVAAELRVAELPTWKLEEVKGRARDRGAARAIWEYLIPATDRIVAREAKMRCQARAAVLRVALARYEVEQGKPAARLDDLVPRYLPRLPLDPFSGRTFSYRVSTGERIENVAARNRIENVAARNQVEREQPESVFPRVARGQGVLWSTGPDGTDNGGTKQGLGFSMSDAAEWSRNQLDLIFLVPRWAKR